jgi:transcriptional regulator with XRE-family HTH domain
MIKKEFAQLVKTHREKMNLSQQELADRSGLSRGTIMHIENANQKVFLEQALMLANILKFDITALTASLDNQMDMFEV